MENKINDSSNNKSKTNISDYYFLFTNTKESEKLLETYTSFIEQYYETVNGYYKKLTEINCHFLQEDKFKSIIDTPIFKLGKSIKNAVKTQIDNLFSIITNEKIFIAFKTSLANLSKVIKESTIKYDQKSFNQYIINIASSLYETHAEIEKQVIDDYISKNYNRHLPEMGNEPLSTKIEQANYLEKTFLDFEEGSKNILFDNIKEMDEKVVKVFNDMKNTVENIISVLKANSMDFLDVLQNEINLITKMGNEGNENSNKNQESEKKVGLKNNEKLDIFKYRIKIINDSIIKVKKPTLINDKDNENKNQEKNDKKTKNKEKKNKDNKEIKNKENKENKEKSDKENKEKVNKEKEEKSKIKSISKDNEEELILTDEDIYNIVSTLYNYNFKMLDKSEYNLEREKEKLIVNQLSEKLFSYKLKNNTKETITDEEVNHLYELLKNIDNLIKFFILLNNFRATGKFEMTESIFNIIKNIFYIALDYIFVKPNKELDGLIIVLSQTFYIEKDDKKIYIQEVIKDHALFQKEEFWKDHLNTIIDEEINKIEKNEKIGKMVFPKGVKMRKIKEIITTKIVPISSYMSEFGASKELILKVINPIIDKYNLDETTKILCLSLIKDK